MRQCRPQQSRLACNSLQDHQIHSHAHHQHQNHHHHLNSQQQNIDQPQIQMRMHRNIDNGINENIHHPPRTQPPPLPPLVQQSANATIKQTTNSLNQNQYATTIVENQQKQHITMTQQVTSTNHNNIHHHHNYQNHHNHHDHDQIQRIQHRHQYHNSNILSYQNGNINNYSHNHIHYVAAETNNSNHIISQHNHNHLSTQYQQEAQIPHPNSSIQPRQNDLPPLPPHPNTITQSNINEALVHDTNNIPGNHPHQDDYTETVIHAILEAKDAMNKPIEERDERDILLIDYLCSLVHGFNPFSKTIRRALAAQAVLIVIEEKGKELIVHSEELDSFCVLIFGECVQLDATKCTPVRYYHIGDSFGVCEPTTETIRFVGNMITKSENCAFLCVKRDDFYTILTDPANYPSKEIIRHRDKNGTVCCVSVLNSDKKSSGPLWSHHMQSSATFKLDDGHIIVKVSSDRLYRSDMLI